MILEFRELRQHAYRWVGSAACSWESRLLSNSADFEAAPGIIEIEAGSLFVMVGLSWHLLDPETAMRFFILLSQVCIAAVGCAERSYSPSRESLATPPAALAPSDSSSPSYGPNRADWPTSGSVEGLTGGTEQAFSEGKLNQAAQVDGTSSIAETEEGRPQKIVAQADPEKAREPATNEPAVAEQPAAEAPALKAKPGVVREAARKNEPPSMARQIIYTATLQLVVRDFEKARKEVQELLAQFDGYVADSDIGSRSGSVRTGRWVVRIPVPQYQPFLDSLGDVGVPENLTQKAQDVTQEFIDLTARIVNQRHLEDRLAKLLEERSGDLKQAIEVERELARVRGEIETMQGRLRFLQNQTSLSTVTIVVREERDYVPPQAPSFGGRIASVWFNSLHALQQFGEALVLVAVATAPWLAILVVLVVVLRGVLRWLRPGATLGGVESR